MRTFAPLTEADLPVDEALLGALVATFGRLGRWVLGRRGIACFPRHPEQRLLLQAWSAGLRHHASGAAHTDGGT